MYYIYIVIIFIILLFVSYILLSQIFFSNIILYSLLISIGITFLIKNIFRPFEGFKNKDIMKIKEKLDNNFVELTDKEKDLLTQVNESESKIGNDGTIDNTNKINEEDNSGKTIDTTKMIITTETGASQPLQKQDISLRDNDAEIQQIEDLQQEVIDLEEELQEIKNEFKTYLSDIGVKFDSNDEIPVLLQKMKKYGKNILNEEYNETVSEFNKSPYILLDSKNWVNEKRCYDSNNYNNNIISLSDQYLNISKSKKEEQMKMDV
jgi:low affinity Fe/Cu permease